MKYDFNIDMTSDNSLSLILREIKPYTTVLEFGPAKGYMTAYLKYELNCKVIGVEIDAEAAKIAESFVERMIVCDAETLEWKNEIPVGVEFDHIIFADVLEHLKYPEIVLKEASAYLKPNGTILTSIPNIGHSAVIIELLKGKFEYRSLGLLDNTHLRFFTRQSVKELMSKADLKPLKWKTTNMSPEHTELKQDYTSLPVEVSDFLIARQDAHVYQFITVSGKISEYDSIEEVVENTSYVFAEYAQLFWAKDKKFNEDSSLKVSINPMDKSLKLYQFNVTDEFLHHPLRFDPTNFEGLIEIDHIILSDENGNVINRWIGQNVASIVTCMHDIEYISNEEKCVLSAYGSDPQLLLHFDLMQTEEEYQVSIHMKIQRDSEGFLSQYAQYMTSFKKEISNIQNEILITKIEKNELINSLEELKVNQDVLITKLIQLENDLDISGNEIDLLKTELRTLENEKSILLNSRSWKLTKPLRWLTNIIRGVSERK
ncbi:2-polyprenyl-3-methyl-5-hydroxy-6-metoxy-1,4-benzoquinol methylase [Paenibacillus endophyticus]|uniref:2-polyprenyl-3-methyl-5-hydroxy-6-metoxy-1, 4-benzoquinol methylase n=1 Tax=Paenibacillus endophyticus TaxID=1294268 RepID=A0A7W5C549_9BACL|nr:methyltransferase domain-containing protein [Paenibacillus endophyticus]MBB3150884.1 2-polyprenyl-3-methyl-5-hydroxy-6-metoxy-1,4-benzoquinol methylase [Paenibacillus endophyticus]